MAVTASPAVPGHGRTTNQGGKEIPEMINENNVKIVAFSLLIVLLVGNGVNYVLYGRDTCLDLLTSGTYLGLNVWQPSGCMMHTYKTIEAKKCFSGQRVVFIGDSRIRQLYFTFSKMLVGAELHTENLHSNLYHADPINGIKLEFLWQPEVNDSLIREFKDKVMTSAVKPALVVIGAASWSIKTHNASPSALKQYTVNLTQLRPLFLQTAKDTELLWMMQAPSDEHLLKDDRKMITSRQLDMYNQATEDVLRHTNIQLWKSAVETSGNSRADTTDGLHLSDEALSTDSQLLYNLLCNSKMHPGDATCCVGSTAVLNSLQIAAFGFFSACGFIAVFLRVCLVPSASHTAAQEISPTGTAARVTEGPTAAGRDPESALRGAASKPSGLMTVYTLTSSLAKFGVILLYVYIADRTDLLQKEQKHFTHLGFLGPLLYVLVLGIFFTNKTKQPTVLNIDQTTEWKGWMQVCLLVYHITGASQNIPIYMHMRVVVAGYLFLTAYGHFTASWDKRKFGLVRVCQVMLRLNLLVVFLCIVMDRPYAYYYFIPLVSFWYLVVYATMALPPRVTRESAQENSSHNVYMLIKLGTLLVVCMTLAASEILFNSLFSWWPFNVLFYGHDHSLHEWWFRWRLDRYIVLFGMLFAMGYIGLRANKKLDDNHSDDLFPWPWDVISCAAGFLLMAITGFILLRNSSGYLRVQFSALFAWFGKISLELFIIQYHISLAQDTKGLLVLIPGHRTLNKIAVMFIFIFIAHEISCLTSRIAKCVISEDYTTTRNRLLLFAVFLAVLLAYSVYS